MAALSALALGISGYLGWHYLAGGPVIGCGVDSPCERALNSRWATIGGVVPVSGLAAGVYLAMLLAILQIGPKTEASIRRLAWRAMLILASAAAGSAAWFIFVQKWDVGAFCPYCMTAHVAGLILAGLIFWQSTKQMDGGPAAMRRVISLRGAAGLALCGLALSGILAATQAAFPPPPVYRGGAAAEKLAVVDPHDAPILGPPDAPYVVTLLFDYKCVHCQQLHFMAQEAVRRYDGKLAFVLCPAPLNPQCNPSVPRETAEFKDSCELARIGLSVWAAKREVFAEFDLWMFSYESGDRWLPRSVEAAKAKAAELAGQKKFDAAMAGLRVDGYLKASIKIYADSNESGNALPRLVYGSRWVIPQPNDADHLISIMREAFGLPAPSL